MYALSVVDGSRTAVLYAPGSDIPVRSARLVDAGKEVGGGVIEQTIDVSFDGNQAAVMGWMEQVERVLRALDGPAVLRLEISEVGPVYETPVYAWRWENLPEMGASLRMGVRLVVSRAGWWEGAEAAVPLSNITGSNVTTGLTVYNHNDGTHVNYADVGAAAIGGDLPARCRLEVENSGSGQVIGAVYASLNVRSAPASFGYVLEGEAAGLAAGSALPTSDVNSSGGQYQRASWSGTDEVVALGWEMSDTQMTAAGGRAIRPVVRFANTPAAVWVRMMIGGGTVGSPLPVWYGPRALLLAGQLQILPAIYLPPGLGRGGSMGWASLYLMAQAASAGSYQLDVDAVQLLAVDGWRRFSRIGDNALGYLQTLVDDGLQGVVYTLSGGGRLATHAGMGEDLRLTPGVAQRLMVLVDGGATAPIGYQVKLRLAYRPRWREVAQ